MSWTNYDFFPFMVKILQLRVAKNPYVSSVATQPSFNKSAPTTSDSNNAQQPVSQQSNHASSYVPESGFDAADESFTIEEGNIFSAKDAFLDMRNIFGMDHQLFNVSHCA